jgi:hypothetical protein
MHTMRPMRSSAAVRRLLRLGPIALCALSAHATLHRSLFPGDDVHGYLGWYEPLVAVLSAGSALVVLAATFAVIRRRPSRTLRELATLVDARPTPAFASRLAAFGVAWLLLQETIERSVSAGRLEPATFGVSAWIVVVATASLAAAVLTVLARAGQALAGVLVRGRPERGSRPLLATWHLASAPPARRRALADRRGLRAPPCAA